MPLGLRKPQLLSPLLDLRHSSSEHHFSSHGNSDKSPGRAPMLSPHLSLGHGHAPPKVPPQPVVLSFCMESPPVVLYGPPKESSGSLLSGIFNLDVLANEAIPMALVELEIIQVIQSRVPMPDSVDRAVFRKSNPEIRLPRYPVSHYESKSQPVHVLTQQMAKWDVLSKPVDLPPQRHAYPFSHLLPGEIPATCCNSLFSVSYYLRAHAIAQDPSLSKYELVKPLQVNRSIIKSVDRNSLRVFPPTDLSAQVSLPSVVYPHSSINVSLVLDGIIDNAHFKDRPDENRRRWRLHKVNWRVDESAKHCPPEPHTDHQQGQAPPQQQQQPPTTNALTPPVSSPSTHTSSSSFSSITSLTGSPSTTSATSDPKRKLKGKEKLETEKPRTVTGGELRSGWKTDFSRDRGRVELETEIPITGNSLSVCCDIDDPVLGLSVTHVLVFELVVSEEACNSKTTRQFLPTGLARVLRMQFSLIVTERSGLGISWDDEVPPMYEDVPLSPPDYNMVAQIQD